MKFINVIKKAVAIVLCTSVLTSVTACSENKSGNDSNGKLKIVTTVFPPYDFAKQIAGDKADIKMLLPVGSETHHYDPTPSDMIAVKDCDVFIYIGGSNEEWAEKLLSDTDREKVKVVKLIDHIDDLSPSVANNGHSHEGEEHSDDHGHSENDYDQHIWTSPKNAKIMLSAICDALCEADAENSESYKESKEKYENEITALQDDFKAAADITGEKILVFADKFPFTYLAKEFGFTCLAAFSSCSDESEPSAATVAMIIDEVKAHKIPAVFYLQFSSKKVADNICNETGAVAYPLHTCHNVSKEEFESGESYVSLMRKNLQNIEKVLKG